MPARKTRKINLSIVYNNKEDKERDLNLIKTIKDRETNINSMAGVIQYLLKGYEEGYTQHYMEMISVKVQEAKDRIGCELLKFNSEKGFMCYEGYSKGKKVIELGQEEQALIVIENCELCRIDRHLRLRGEIEKKFRMKSINELSNTLNDIAEEWATGRAPVSFYLCKIEGHPVSISQDQAGIHCPKVGYGVSIEGHCKINCNAIQEVSLLAKSESREELKEKIDKLRKDISPDSRIKTITDESEKEDKNNEGNNSR